MNEYAEIKQSLERIERLTMIGATSVLDLQEAAALTGFSTGHIYRLTSSGQIPHYKKNRKLYFKKSELEEWMLEQKVLTDKELNGKAETYIATH